MLSLSVVPVTRGQVKSLAFASGEDVSVKEMVEEAGSSGVANGWRALEDGGREVEAQCDRRMRLL